MTEGVWSSVPEKFFPTIEGYFFPLLLWGFPVFISLAVSPLTPLRCLPGIWCEGSKSRRHSSLAPASPVLELPGSVPCSCVFLSQQLIQFPMLECTIHCLSFYNICERTVQAVPITSPDCVHLLLLISSIFLYTIPQSSNSYSPPGIYMHPLSSFAHYTVSYVISGISPVPSIFYPSDTFPLTSHRLHNLLNY